MKSEAIQNSMFLLSPNNTGRLDTLILLLDYQQLHNKCSPTF